MPYSGSYGTPRLDLGEAFYEYMYSPDKFIASEVFGLFDSPKKKGTFSKIRRESLLRPASDLKRAPKSSYNRDDFDAEDQSFECEEYGTEVQLDHSDREFYKSDFDAEKAATEVGWHRLMVGFEQRVATILFDGTTNFTVANGKRTDVSAAWSTASTDIIGDVQTAKEKVRSRTGENPNALVIGAGVVPFLMKNTGIKAAMSNDERKGIEAIKSALASIFGLDKIIIGQAVTNAQNEGQTMTSATDVWSSIWASVCKVADSGSSLVTPCVGRSLLWVADSPDAALMEEYEEPQTRSTVFRARHWMDELLIDANFAQLLDIAA